MVRITKELRIELQMFLHMFSSGRHPSYEVTEDGIPSDATIEKARIEGDIAIITFTYTTDKIITPTIKKID